MYLTKDVDGYYTKFMYVEDLYLSNVHQPRECYGRGCGIHAHPSNHALKEAPLNWRTDRGILERVCEHGVGHPDADSADYLTSIGKGYENIHGCDGCCGGNYYGGE